MDPTAQFVTTVLGALVVFGAFAAWLVHHMDKRLDEAKADTRRQFDETNANTRQGFDRMREHHLRLEKKLDSQAARIADLRQDVGRLQGIVERTHDPARFVVPPAREVAVGEEVREAPASYDTGPGGEGPERQDET